MYVYMYINSYRKIFLLAYKSAYIPHIMHTHTQWRNSALIIEGRDDILARCRQFWGDTSYYIPPF